MRFLRLANVLITGDMATSTSEPTPAPVLVRRTDTACLRSVWKDLSPPTPTDSRVNRSLSGKGCTLTAPASLSSPVMDYISVVRTYLSTIESKAKAIKTDCGAAKPSFTLSLACSSSLEILFTDKTSTMTSSADLPSVGTSIPLGNGARSIVPRVSLSFASFVAVWAFLS
ncbi:hypothetical protein ED733_001674 [Metarhizium rileyi]|uniref:Uncharacterized protein n=1 Tax=Metarhizium rileyi (strain RCEF 4871) TaxID=1649241 RepID=A0A5C6G0Z5_METRR|nr:hypothetical protein ED733_001674 [Metarhizium rileyi]